MYSHTCFHAKYTYVLLYFAFVYRAQKNSVFTCKLVAFKPSLSMYITRLGPT